MSSTHWTNILVSVADPFAEDQPALSKAAALARRCGAVLNVFNAFMLPQVMPGGAYHSSEEVLTAAIRQRKERLQTLAARLRLNGNVKVTVRWDHPTHEAIVREVLQSKPELLVTDSHRHRRLVRLVLANTDWELIRSCPCPLWFVRSMQLPRRLNVLVAVDPTHARAKPARLDSRLLTSARGLVEQLGGNIDVLHALETPASGWFALRKTLGLPAPKQRERDPVEEAAVAVRKLAGTHFIEASNCHVKTGVVSDVIEVCVRQLKSDVLVMGAVSRSSLGAVPFIGGTAERVIDQVGCDVLVIKPAGFKTPIARRFPTLPNSGAAPRRRPAVA
jgi:universal stress protein E